MPALTTVSSSGKPLIGIPVRLDFTQDVLYLKRYYAEAVFAAGGIPLHIPLITDQEYLRHIGMLIDGLMLSGSDSDIDPARYGEEPQPNLGPVVPERDETDLFLLSLAEDRRIPVLGICFGCQSLNVSRGGMLIQDIPSQVPAALKHSQGLPANRPSHQIDIEQGSLLAELAGTDCVRVNSSHHQAIRKVGHNLRAIARAHDGITEAIVDPRPDRFVLGVQWHPEVGWEKDALSQAIFKRFVAEAEKRMTTRKE